MRLLLSYTIRREWQARCIADVVPGLTGYAGQSHIDIDAATAREVIQDCRFQADPQAMDHPLPVRQAYRALQIRLTRLLDSVALATELGFATERSASGVSTEASV